MNSWLNISPTSVCQVDKNEHAEKWEEKRQKQKEND